MRSTRPGEAGHGIRPEIEVLVSGGRLRTGDLALSNAQTLAFFSDLRADLTILGSGGVSAGGGLSDYHVDGRRSSRPAGISRSPEAERRARAIDPDRGGEALSGGGSHADCHHQ